MPGHALDTAIAAARIASPVITGPGGTLHAFVPEKFRLVELENDRYLSPWPKQRITVDDRASLSAYANRFKGQRSILIADYDKGVISARLDWHADNLADVPGATGADEHSVTLKLRFSEEFERWNGRAGKLVEQEEFARFLEENSVDVGMPEAATMIEIARDFEATVGQTYKSSNRLDNGDRKLVFETESKVRNDVIIPTVFTLSIPIYHGEEPDTLTCLFRWRAAGGAGVLLGFEWKRLEYQRRAHFAQIATAAAEETGLPLFFGRQGNPA